MAVDDDDEGWPDHHRERLVLTDSMQGLSAPRALDELMNKLEAYRHSQSTTETRLNSDR
ncbi:hypothetical protein D3C78_1598280 [compost metagenome]